MADGDLLNPVVPDEQQHKFFKSLIEMRAHAPHREMLRTIWSAFPNPDGGFVKEFQTHHFDSRLWELYIFALGHFSPFVVTRPHDAPDFLFEGNGLGVWIEATTANPSAIHPVVPGEKTDEQIIFEMNEELPIRLGSPLFSKLKDRYWELPHVSGKPFVIAIGDFSQGNGPRHSDFALHRYLYGLDARVISLPGETVRLEPVTVATHSAWKDIPSGFFNLPDAEHISAVIFSSEGTFPKFGRMGFRFDRHPFVRMLRVGGCIDFDPRATIPNSFGYLVGDAPEDWGHGAYVYHNPNAKHPVPLDVFRGIGGQHWVSNGESRNELREFSPMSSMTFTFQAPEGRVFSEADDESFRQKVAWLTEQLDRDTRRRLEFHAWRDKIINNPR